jgi:hypothetical protein
MKHWVKSAVVSASMILGGPAVANVKGALFVPELKVNQISATEFEVLEGQSQGARTYWCAAAYHAQYDLGLTSGRIYLSRPFGPARTASGTRGVSFSTTETADAKDLVSLSIRQPGATLLIGHAIQFCRDSDLEADQ